MKALLDIKLFYHIKEKSTSLKNGTDSLERIQDIIDQFAAAYSPDQAAESARRAIDTNFIIMDPKKLPPVNALPGSLISGLTVAREGTTANDALKRAREWMAVAEKLEHLEKEKANRERYLNKKRDEVHRRLYPTAPIGCCYNSSLTAVKTAIDEIVRIEEELDAAKKYR